MQNRHSESRKNRSCTFVPSMNTIRTCGYSINYATSQTSLLFTGKERANMAASQEAQIRSQKTKKYSFWKLLRKKKGKKKRKKNKVLFLYRNWYNNQTKRADGNIFTFSTYPTSSLGFSFKQTRRLRLSWSQSFSWHGAGGTKTKTVEKKASFRACRWLKLLRV